MTPIRVGDSWARTSLPPRPSAATVAAEFRRSDLRDVIVFMDPPCELCDRWPRCRSVSSSIWITLFEVNAPVTSGDRELTDPSKIGCTCVRRNPAAFLPQAAVRPPDMAPHSEAGPASADKSVEPAPSTAPHQPLRPCHSAARRRLVTAAKAAPRSRPGTRLEWAAMYPRPRAAGALWRAPAR